MPAPTTAMHGAASDGTASDDSEDDSSTLNIFGAILFSTLLACVFAFTCFHFLRGRAAAKLHAVKPIDSTGTPCEGTLDCSQPHLYEHSRDLKALATSNEGVNVVLHASSEGLSQQQGLCGADSSKNIDDGVHDIAFDEYVTLGNWVGSADWVASRELRKKRVSEILQRSVIVGQTCNTKPLAGNEAPQAPSMPPPELEILLPGANSGEADDTQRIALANAMVHEELKNTAATDIERRKKTFKILCARWHPDKSQPGHADFATEVFQYLQAQKAWYLDRRESVSAPMMH